MASLSKRFSEIQTYAVYDFVGIYIIVGWGDKTVRFVGISKGSVSSSNGIVLRQYWQ